VLTAYVMKADLKIQNHSLLAQSFASCLLVSDILWISVF